MYLAMSRWVFMASTPVPGKAKRERSNLPWSAGLGFDPSCGLPGASTPSLFLAAMNLPGEG